MFFSKFKITCKPGIDLKIDSDEETKEDLTSVHGGKCRYGWKCKIYLAARDQYQVSPKIWGHLTDVSHPYTRCRYGEKCFSHLRLLAGGHELKDIVHHAVFYHSRAATASERGFEIEDIILSGFDFFRYWHHKYDQPKILEKMLQEIKKNGYERCLTTPNGDSLLDVARSKMKLPCFKYRRAKLEHFFALLIYTGTAMQSDIRKEFRTDDDISSIEYKWGYVSRTICRAVKLLSEEPPKLLYHGLNGVKAKNGDVVFYDNFVSFSQSFEVAKDFANGNPTVKKPKKTGMILVLDTSQLKDGSKSLVNSYFYFADMRKISKFPGEEEWLFYHNNPPTSEDKDQYQWKLKEIKEVGNVKRMTMSLRKLRPGALSECCG